MIHYLPMSIYLADRLGEIDRSEFIDRIYEQKDEELIAKDVSLDCPSWTDDELQQIRERFVLALEQGGWAVGAWEGDRLAGFGVLDPQWRGPDKNQLQVDLLYVSRPFRRQGIGTGLLDRIGEEAFRRGASSLYISSTETQSAVSFYRSNNGQVTDRVDEELFRKEPHDIHMVKRLR